MIYILKYTVIELIANDCSVIATSTSENQSRHVPFAMLALILQLLKNVWLIYVYISYNTGANACAYRFSCYIATGVAIDMHN